jgi:hypothetical protein
VCLIITSVCDMTQRRWMTDQQFIGPQLTPETTGLLKTDPPRIMQLQVVQFHTYGILNKVQN